MYTVDELLDIIPGHVRIAIYQPYIDDFGFLDSSMVFKGTCKELRSEDYDVLLDSVAKIEPCGQVLIITLPTRKEPISYVEA